MSLYTLANYFLVGAVIGICLGAVGATLLCGFSFLCWKLDQIKIERAEKNESRSNHHGAGFRSGHR